MLLVIDANVFMGYFKEYVLGISNDLTNSTLPIFSRIGEEDIVFFDFGGNIEFEWRNIINNDEWFDVWVARKLIDGGIQKIKAINCYRLEQNLSTYNFPRDSRDKWYIRTAKTIIEHYRNDFDCNHLSSFLITEDLDFYFPYKKSKVSGIERINLIKHCKSDLVEFLKNSESIFVTCVENVYKYY